MAQKKYGPAPKKRYGSMVIISCIHCDFHEIRKDDREEISYCRKENCFSRHTKCILKKALENFLKQQEVKTPQRQA